MTTKLTELEKAACPSCGWEIDPTVLMLGLGLAMVAGGRSPIGFSEGSQDTANLICRKCGQIIGVTMMVRLTTGSARTDGE